MKPDPTQAPPGPARLAWSRRLWEPVTLVLIGLGLFMLMQPFSKEVFSYSFVVLLTGVLGYTVAGKLPE